MVRFGMLLMLIMAVTAVAGCATTGGTVVSSSAPDPGRGQVYAYVNDQPVYAADIAAQLTTLPPYQRQQLERQPDKLQAFVEDFLTARLVADEARAQNLNASDTFQRKLREAEDQLLVEQLMQVLFARVAPPTDTEVQIYYRDNLVDFTRPAAVRLMFVVVGDSATADKVYQEAKGGASFAALQARYSTTPDSVTVLQVDNLPPALRAPVAALPVDGIMAPFPTTATSIYVFKKLENIPLQLIPFAEARDTARQAAYRERVTLFMTAYLETLKRDHPFRVVGTIGQIAAGAGGDGN